MATYSVTIDEAANRRLWAIANELGRPVESLIEASAEEAALEYYRNRSDDPAKSRT